MKLHVLDTSVAVSWYLPEAFSHHSRRWLQGMREGSLHFVVPSHHYWEFANVMRTQVRLRQLEERDAMAIFSTHLLAPLRVHEPDRQTVLRTALEYDATVYDAVYIALSLALDAPLVTAERKTTPWVQRLGERAVSVLL
jgi:predicted nucleic acid-binding protein